MFVKLNQHFSVQKQFKRKRAPISVVGQRKIVLVTICPSYTLTLNLIHSLEVGINVYISREAQDVGLGGNVVEVVT